MKPVASPPKSLSPSLEGGEGEGAPLTQTLSPHWGERKKGRSSPPREKGEGLEAPLTSPLPPVGGEESKVRGEE